MLNTQYSPERRKFLLLLGSGLVDSTAFLSACGKGSSPSSPSDEQPPGTIDDRIPDYSELKVGAGFNDMLYFGWDTPLDTNQAVSQYVLTIYDRNGNRIVTKNARPNNILIRDSDLEVKTLDDASKSVGSLYIGGLINQEVMAGPGTYQFRLEALNSQGAVIRTYANESVRLPLTTFRLNYDAAFLGNGDMIYFEPSTRNARDNQLSSNPMHGKLVERDISDAVDVGVYGLVDNNPNLGGRGARFVFTPSQMQQFLTEREISGDRVEGLNGLGSTTIVDFFHSAPRSWGAYLSLTHLSSINQGVGFAPVEVIMNGRKVVERYSPESHDGNNGQTDTFDLRDFLWDGANTLAITLHPDAKTHYWLKSVDLSDRLRMQSADELHAPREGSGKPATRYRNTNPVTWNINPNDLILNP